MFPNHDLYRMEYEERLRKILEQGRMERLLPVRRNWFVQLLNQVRMYLW